MLSDSSEVSGGLKQSDSLSPILFNIALEKAIKGGKLTTVVFVIECLRVLLVFADDIGLVGNTVIKWYRSCSMKLKHRHAAVDECTL